MKNISFPETFMIEAGVEPLIHLKFAATIHQYKIH